MKNQYNRVNAEEFIRLSDDIAVIDVRTSSEFQRGHIPGAINIALFNDAERAEVGILYKKKGQYQAVLKGLDFVGPKMSVILDEAVKQSADKKKLLVYCWRGGRRSGSMAWLFSNADIECFVLDGGYKAYRNSALNYLSEKRKLIILGGYTGTGKTEILKVLRQRGEQVVDLEGLANHRGSAFGALGQGKQPGSEHYANLLYDEMRKYDRNKRLFLEDESQNIGSVFMPDAFYKLIRQSKVIALFSEAGLRLPRLIKEYGAFGSENLLNSVDRISKRLGGENAKIARESIVEGRIDKAVEIVLAYYDKAYLYGLSKRSEGTVTKINTGLTDPEELADLVIEQADRLNI